MNAPATANHARPLAPRRRMTHCAAAHAGVSQDMNQTHLSAGTRLTSATNPGSECGMFLGVSHSRTDKAAKQRKSVADAAMVASPSVLTPDCLPGGCMDRLSATRTGAPRPAGTSVASPGARTVSPFAGPADSGVSRFFSASGQVAGSGKRTQAPPTSALKRRMVSRTRFERECQWNCDTSG
jgi:hypothetical protein